MFSFYILNVGWCGYGPLTEHAWETVIGMVRTYVNPVPEDTMQRDIAALKQAEGFLVNKRCFIKMDKEVFENEVVRPLAHLGVCLHLASIEAQDLYLQQSRKLGIPDRLNPRCTKASQLFQPLVNALFELLIERRRIDEKRQCGALMTFAQKVHSWFFKDHEGNYEIFCNPTDAKKNVIPLYVPFIDPSFVHCRKSLVFDAKQEWVKDASVIIRVIPEKSGLVFRQRFYSGGFWDGVRNLPPFCEEIRDSAEEGELSYAAGFLKEQWEEDGRPEGQRAYLIVTQPYKDYEESACMLACLKWLEDLYEGKDQELSCASKKMLEWIEDEAGRDITTLKEALEEDLKERTKAAYAERVRAEQKERQEVIASGGDLNTRPHKVYKNKKHVQKTRRTQASKSQVEKGTHEQPQEALQTLCEEMKTVGRAKFRDVKRVLNRVFKKLPKAMTESQRGAHHNIHIKGAGGVTVVRPHGRKDRSIPLKGLYAKVIQACLNGKGTDVEQPVREHKAP